MNKARIVKHAQCVFLQTKTTVVNESEIQKNRFKWIEWIHAGITEAITEVNDWGSFVRSFSKSFNSSLKFNAVINKSQNSRLDRIIAWTIVMKIISTLFFSFSAFDNV